MKDRQGVLWEAIEAASKLLDINREGMQSETAFNADVTPVIDLARAIVERCAAIADKQKHADFPDADVDYAEGRKQASQSIAEEILALLSDEANRRK